MELTYDGIIRIANQSDFEYFYENSGTLQVKVNFVKPTEPELIINPNINIILNNLR